MLLEATHYFRVHDTVRFDTRTLPTTGSQDEEGLKCYGLISERHRLETR